MKIIFSLITIANIFAQQNDQFISKSVQDYARYFDRNQSTLDPIEGIWQESAVGTLYKDNKVVSRLEEDKRAIWIVVKKYRRIEMKNDKPLIKSNSLFDKLKTSLIHFIKKDFRIEKYFLVLNIDGRADGFNAYFTREKSGLYFFTCNLFDVDESIYTRALLNNNNIIMEYNAPLSFIEFFSNTDHSKNKFYPEDNLFWQIEWKKLN
tara:strand:- start:123 stop:743 length:621 start_codon:yes stop_codon:yes gene_type:complete